MALLSLVSVFTPEKERTVAGMAVAPTPCGSWQETQTISPAEVFT